MLSRNALARIRAAGVQVDSVALAAVDPKASARMPSPSTQATAGAPDGEAHLTPDVFNERLSEMLHCSEDDDPTQDEAEFKRNYVGPLLKVLYSAYTQSSDLRSAFGAAVAAWNELLGIPGGTEATHVVASVETDKRKIEEVALFASVAASNRVRQSLVTASSCKGSSVETLAYRFAATEAIAAYNKTPDHQVKVPVTEANLTALASTLAA